MRKSFWVVLVVLLGGAWPAHAATITATVAGADTFTTAEMYLVEFTSGSPGEFVQSVSFDLSVDSDAFFDFDGDATFNDATAPVLGTLTGLLAGDISFQFVGSHPTLLTFTFGPGTFGIGDSFTFGADTDFLVSDPTPGSAFGTAGVLFSASLEGGASASTAFSVLQPNFSSQASVTLDATAVPEPASLTLLGAGLAGLGARRWRQRKTS